MWWKWLLGTGGVLALAALVWLLYELRHPAYLVLDDGKARLIYPGDPDYPPK